MSIHDSTAVILHDAPTGKKHTNHDTRMTAFVVRNTQKRNPEIMLVKLHEGVHEAPVDLQQLEEEEIELIRVELIRAKYQRLAELARAELRRGYVDMENPCNVEAEGAAHQARALEQFE